MNNIRYSLQRLSLNNKPFLNELIGTLRRSIVSSGKLFSHDQNMDHLNDDDDVEHEQEHEYFKWLEYNNKFYPIQSPNEERRPAVYYFL